MIFEKKLIVEGTGDPIRAKKYIDIFARATWDYDLRVVHEYDGKKWYLVYGRVTKPQSNQIRRDIHNMDVPSILRKS